MTKNQNDPYDLVIGFMSLFSVFPQEYMLQMLRIDKYTYESIMNGEIKFSKTLLDRVHLLIKFLNPKETGGDYENLYKFWNLKLSSGHSLRLLMGSKYINEDFVKNALIEIKELIIEDSLNPTIT